MSAIRINSTAADISNMLYQQQAEQAESVYYEMAKHFWAIIGTANQVAYMAILEAVDMMREAGMLRQKQKVKALKALEEFDRYQHGAYMVFQGEGDDRYPLWQDLTLRAANKLQPDVQRLYFAIKNVIDREGVSHSEVHAQVQTAVALVTLATLLFDTMADQFQKFTVMDGEVFNQERAASEARRDGARLARTPLDRLRERDVWHADNMIDYFANVLNKSLIGFSSWERHYIYLVGMAAFNRTMKKLQEQEKK